MSDKVLSVRVVMKDVATGVLNKIGSGLGRFGTNLGKIDIRMGKIASGAFRMLTSMRGAFAGLAAFFAARGILRSFDEIIDKMDMIAKVSGRTGIAVETVGELELIAQRAEIPLEQLAKVVGDVTSRIAEAAIFGSGAGFRILERLGIDAKDANGQIKDTVDLLDELVRGVSRVESVAEREFLLKQLGGEQAPKLLQVVNLGVEEFARLKARAREIGVFSARDVQLAADYKDAIADLKRSWDLIKGVFVTAIVPIVLPAIEAMRVKLTGLREQAMLVADAISVAFGPASGANLEDSIERYGIAPGQLRGELIGALAETGKAVAEFGLDIGIGIVTNIFKGMAAALGSGLLPFAVAEGFVTLGRTIIDSIGRGMAGLAGDNPTGDAFNANMLEALAMLEEQWAPGGEYGRHVEQLRTAVLANAQRQFGEVGRGIVLDVDSSFSKLEKRASDAFSFLGFTMGQIREVVQGVDTPAFVPPVPDPPQVSAWQRFLGGIRSGAQAAGEKLGDLANIGAQVGAHIAQTFAAQATDALFAFVDGTKTAAQAFSEFASSVLRDVSRMITQILILRAISGIAGAFAGGGGNGLPGTAELNIPAGTKPLNRGGWAVPRYDRGGFTVPGPNVNRDMVLGLLTPGERVLSRQEVRGLRSGQYAFAGEGGGGGDTFNVALTVNLSGGATPKDARLFQDAVESALYSIQARKPRARRQLGLTPQGV